MKYLIAGLGSIGRRHLRNLIALGEQDVVLYRTRKSTLPEDELAQYHTETDLATALAFKPDAVIVANPTSLHYATTLAALQAGCHVLLEKPVSHTLEGLDELLAAQQAAKKQVLVGFQFRFHPVLNEIKTLLASGELGKPLSARVVWAEYLPGWHPWEDYRKAYAARADLGGGVVLTLCHPLDYLRWLLGEVEGLSAISGNISDLELDVEDSADISLKFKQGCVGTVHLDYYQRLGAHKFEISCSAGMIEWNNATASARVYRVADQAWQDITPFDGFERNHLFLAEMQHFINLVKGEESTPRCTLADGMAAMKLVDAVYQSDGSFIKI